MHASVKVGFRFPKNSMFTSSSLPNKEIYLFEG